MTSCPRMAITVFAILAAALVGAGCGQNPERVPTYPSMDADASLKVVTDNAHKVHTLTGTGLITLTRPDGQSVRLDAALAMQPPQRVRMRAWKFGRAIFDLTVTPEGVWAVMPDDDSNRREQIHSAGVSAARLAKTWSVLSGGFFDSPNLATDVSGSKIVVKRASPDEAVVTCEVDRKTLTPRKYAVLDDNGKERFTLALSAYRQYGDVVWPTKLLATSEGGTVEVALREIDINPELTPDAFKPPRRAEKLP